VLALFAIGSHLARPMPWLATVLLALGSTSAGWVAHDFVHGRGRFCATMRGFGALFNGHSATWWSNKHNLHHACTNQVGVDEDIMADPFFFLWAPDPARDSRWRRLQHLYALPVYSVLFALWRLNSVRTVFTSRLVGEGAWLAVHYTWLLACLPWQVALGHVFLAGLMTATIVTVSHQTEDLYHEQQHDWVRAQIGATRDAATSNPFSEWLWGGMQYQLEHHLFPTMPRYRYAQLVPRVQQLCAEHQIEYRVDGEAAVVARNFGRLREVAEAPAQPDALATRTDTVWSRRQSAAWTASSLTVPA
jgi:fatty acid desaturase